MNTSNVTSRYRDAERALWQSVGLEPVERELDLDRLSTRIRVQEVGEGPVAVFVHGATSAGANWAPLLAHITGLRCIVLERPGCGLSHPADVSNLLRLAAVADALVSDVLDALDIRSAHLVATSLGSYYALRAAAADPDRVMRVVTFGYVFGAPMEHLPMSMRMATVPGVRSVMSRIPPTRPAVRAILRQLGLGLALADGRFSDEMLDWYLALLRCTPTLRNETKFPRDLRRAKPAEFLPPSC